MSQSPYPATRSNFEASSSWLSSTPSAASLPNHIKLEIYGLYKYINSGEPLTSRPSIFYPTPRAKYDAWVEAFRKYSTVDEVRGSGKGEEEAMRRYIDIALSVGWKGEGLGEEEEIDFDAPDEVRKEDKEGGMGTKVSMMSGPEDLNERSNMEGIHDAVIDDDLQSVRAMLEAERTRVNAKDDNNNTPLHLAVDRGHLELVRLLLSFGADKTLQDDDGQTPLNIALLLERADIVLLLQ